MADGGDFDPCECIFNHEMAMRRLLSLLRQSQAYCTDNECLQDGSLPGPGAQQGDSMLFMAMIWALLAMMLYLLRPKSLRSNPGDQKSSGGSQGGPRQDPPAVM